MLIFPRNSGHSKSVRHAHSGGDQHGAIKTSVYSGVQAGGRETGEGKRASDRPGRPRARPHAESVTALEARSHWDPVDAFPGQGRRKPHEEELARRPDRVRRSFHDPSPQEQSPLAPPCFPPSCPDRVTPSHGVSLRLEALQSEGSRQTSSLCLLDLTLQCSLHDLR
jgi:hypothetical protein